ncbi:MAG: protein-L-isoaspartate O-methyltransferase, partial [Dehalococcoidia bacterium]
MESKLKDAKRKLFRKLKLEIGDERVMKAMERVPRELFVPPAHRHLAYEDIPLPIGEGQ